MNTAFLAGYMHKESRDVSLITGNPKYIKDNPDASRFYSKLQSILEGKGYKVRIEFKISTILRSMMQKSPESNGNSKSIIFDIIL